MPVVLIPTCPPLLHALFSTQSFDAPHYSQDQPALHVPLWPIAPRRPVLPPVVPNLQPRIQVHFWQPRTALQSLLAPHLLIPGAPSVHSPQTLIFLVLGSTLCMLLSEFLAPTPEPRPEADSLDALPPEQSQAYPRTLPTHLESVAAPKPAHQTWQSLDFSSFPVRPGWFCCFAHSPTTLFPTISDGQLLSY